MRAVNFIAITLVLLSVSCAPVANTSPPPTESPEPIATSTESVVVENPPACAGANLIYHPGLQESLLIGCVPGSVREESPNIIWGWNGERWRRVTEGGPEMRILGGSAYDEKRDVVVLYSGFSWAEGTCAHETWEWDSTTWTQKDAESPTACDHLRMVYDSAREEIILFGGGDENQNLVAETWAWDGDAWSLISDSGPEGRAHFGFVYDAVHEQGLLYGGYGNSVMDDFWAWKEGEWQRINFPGPGPRSHFGMASDLDANALVLFGGATSTSTFSSLSDQTWRLANGRWSELNLAEKPSPRGSPAMNYDPARQRIVLYGGFASDRSDLEDTWEWDGSQWHCVLNCK